MPKIPQYVAQDARALAPGPRLDIGAVGSLAAAPAKALAQVSDTLAKSASDYAKVNKALSDEEMKLDVADKLSQVRDQLSQEDIALRQEGVDPDQLAETYRSRGQQAIERVAKDLRYPQSVGAFQSKANDLLTTEVIRQRNEGLKLKYARIGVLAELSAQEAANEAGKGGVPVVGDTGNVTWNWSQGDAALKDELGKIDDRARTGLWSQEKAASETTKLLTQVETARARAEAGYLPTRTDTIQALLRGDRPFMPREAQRTLAESMMKADEVTADKAEKAAEKQAKQDKEDAMREWTMSATQGEKPPAQLLSEWNQISRVHRLTDVEYERGWKILTAPPAKEELASDPKTLDRVIADTHSMNPRMTEAQLTALHDQGKLNTKDWQSALDRRRETLESNRREGQSLVMQQHAQAEQEIMKQAGVVTPFSQLDKTQEKLVPEVLTELRRRSRAYPGGKEDPLKVADELIPRIRNTLSRDAAFNKVELERQLTYFSELKLEADRRAGRISNGFYVSERDRLLQWNEYVKREQTLGTPTPGSGTKSGGPTNSLGRTR